MTNKNKARRKFSQWGSLLLSTTPLLYYFRTFLQFAISQKRIARIERSTLLRRRGFMSRHSKLQKSEILDIIPDGVNYWVSITFYLRLTLDFPRFDFPGFFLSLLSPRLQNPSRNWSITEMILWFYVFCVIDS